MNECFRVESTPSKSRYFYSVCCGTQLVRCCGSAAAAHDLARTLNVAAGLRSGFRNGAAVIHVRTGRHGKIVGQRGDGVQFFVNFGNIVNPYNWVDAAELCLDTNAEPAFGACPV